MLIAFPPGLEPVHHGEAPAQAGVRLFNVQFRNRDSYQMREK